LEDKLKIYIENPAVFSLNGKQLRTSYLENGLPVQLKAGDAETIVSAGSSFQGAISSFTASNFFVNLLFAAGLKYLWKMLDSLQLMVFLPMLQIAFPANSKFFF